MKVLIVDDSALVRKVIKNNLIKMNVSEKDIIEVGDGATAVTRLLQVNDIGIVITDLQMPNMNGIELTKKVRNMPKGKDIVVIIITGMLSQDNKKILDELDVYGYIEKPFDAKKFADMVEPVILGSAYGDIAWMLNYDNSTVEIDKDDLQKLIKLGVQDIRIEEQDFIISFGVGSLILDLEIVCSSGKIKFNAKGN